MINPIPIKSNGNVQKKISIIVRLAAALERSSEKKMAYSLIIHEGVYPIGISSIIGLKAYLNDWSAELYKSIPKTYYKLKIENPYESDDGSLAMWNKAVMQVAVENTAVIYLKKIAAQLLIDF